MRYYIVKGKYRLRLLNLNCFVLIKSISTFFEKVWKMEEPNHLS